MPVSRQSGPMSGPAFDEDAEGTRRLEKTVAAPVEVIAPKVTDRGGAEATGGRSSIGT